MSKDNRLALYEKGLSDSKIAKIVGVTQPAIWSWRKKHGLKPNNNRVGRPIEYPNSPLHAYWREQSHKKYAKMRARSSSSTEAS